MSLSQNAKVGTKLAITSGIGILLIAGMIVSQQISSRQIADAAEVVKREQTIMDGIVSAEYALSRRQLAGRGLKLAVSPKEATNALEESRSYSEKGMKALDQPISIAVVPDVLLQIGDGLKDLQDTVEKRTVSDYGHSTRKVAPA